jgi:hypothetical protein
VKEDHIRLPNADGVLPPEKQEDILSQNRTCELGQNL